ncbi:hypothetical protein LBJG_00444 [Lactobacillus jensenii 1153]|nr:hypothetical protein LBJG_00444 [Lactobacillus jensenii 1153]EEX26996.1 hypothetical protein HMPREF0527_01055 [Lactobacillus jensenii SJ-7A-US]
MSLISNVYYAKMFKKMQAFFEKSYFLDKIVKINYNIKYL